VAVSSWTDCAGVVGPLRDSLVAAGFGTCVQAGGQEMASAHNAANRPCLYVARIDVIQLRGSNSSIAAQTIPFIVAINNLVNSIDCTSAMAIAKCDEAFR
jgi:hypothetical protein